MRQQIGIELSSCNAAVVHGPRECTGLGGEGTTTLIEGQVGLITIRRDGEAQVSISIGSEGELTITDFGMNYQTSVPQNMRLEPGRPWRKPG